MIHKPSWFQDEKVMVSTAPTCGLAKGGRLLPIVDKQTGKRLQVTDPDTGELVDRIDDQLLSDIEALMRGDATSTLTFVELSDVNLRNAVPTYFDRRYHEEFTQAMSELRFKGFTSATLAKMAEGDLLTMRGGHGSPTASVRVGSIPYIKVSDLRAGLVNINPTNRVPLAVAQQFWRGDQSGLKAWDLICPERTSKNIGDFCMLLPGQEQIVTTKEVIVLRPGENANFDAFYLMWAMTLSIVRNQWNRVIFMQTNREDVGERFLEIEIPIPPSREIADEVSKSFREYYRSLASARSSLQNYLGDNPVHHFFIGSAADSSSEIDEE